MTMDKAERERIARRRCSRRLGEVAEELNVAEARIAVLERGVDDRKQGVSRLDYMIALGERDAAEAREARLEQRWRECLLDNEAVGKARDAAEATVAEQAAEIERLRGELSRVDEQNAGAVDTLAALTADRDVLRSEVERLEADQNRLENQCIEYASNLRSIVDICEGRRVTDFEESFPVVRMVAEQAARIAEYNERLDREGSRSDEQAAEIERLRNEMLPAIEGGLLANDMRLAAIARAESAEAVVELLYGAIAERFSVEDWTDPRKGITEIEAHLAALTAPPTDGGASEGGR